ncbi:PREDICTED: uncharacterized protein [Prunus dulcis]|uniref:PREDICTED: uncharacterized protein n=1 Tax=Prunus dulcis TaxID=3755 RepID=A0A5E4FZ65_PRUDU|nr:PREDICTED: uncharacterized protein [Prunus dulcis]
MLLKIEKTRGLSGKAFQHVRCTRGKERHKGKSSPFHHRELKSKPAIVSSACEIPIAIRKMA